MKKLYIRNIVISLSFIIVLSSAIMNEAGPGGGLTNAPSEGNCTSCHGGSIITSGNSNLNNLRFKGNFTGNGYIPDSVYNVEVTYKQSGISKFGFEITCLDNNNNPAGTFTAPNARVNRTTTVISGQTREYVQHTQAGTSSVGTDSTRWAFTWKAPSTNVGKVKFYVVVNATDGQSNQTGDVIYGKVFTINTSSLLPVADPSSLDSVTCTNYIAQLKGSGTNSPTSYTWSLPGGNPTSSTSQNPTVIYTSPGTKFAILTVKNSKGTSLKDTLKMTVNPSPSATFQNTNPTSICKGDSVLVGITPVTNATYLWLHNNKTTRTIYLKDVANYTAKVTNITTGCSAITANFTLNHYVDPVISISKGSTNDTFCDSYSETLTATGSLIDSVHWYVNGVLTRRTKTLTTTFSGSNNINVTAIAKSATGCKSILSNAVNIVTRPKLFPVNMVSSKTTSTISLEWDRPPGITTATYSLNNINFFPTTTDTTLLLTGLSPNTSYDITIRSKQLSPCLTSDVTITVKTNACSNLSYIVTHTSRACKGSLMTATVTKLYNAKYSISFDNNPFSKDTIYNFTPGKTDSLIITLIDSLSPTCPPLIDKVGYQVDTLFDKDTGSLIKFTANICDNNYLYNLKSGYTTYEFYKNNVLINTGASSSFMFNGLANGDKLTAIGKINTCQKSYGPVSIVINPKPVSTYTFSRDFKNYTFTATDATHFEYKWFVGSTSLGTGNPKTSDFTAYNNSTVDVKLVAITLPGCTDSSTQSIIVPDFSSINTLQNNLFKLFPNPFGNYITILSKADQYQVRIVNNIGQVVYTMEANAAEQTIATTEWANGIYYILIKDQDNRLSSFTFVKH